MKVIVICSPLLTLILLVAWMRGGIDTASQPLEQLIYSTCKRDQWTQPYISKYFTFKYPPESKLVDYPKTYRWPGSLDRGLGKDCLQAALKLANEKYGCNLDGVNINALPDERKLNLYFFDSNTSPQFIKFKNQCVYIGFKNIILCDAHFLSQFSEISLIEKKLDGYVEQGAHFSTLLDKPKSKVIFLLHDLGASHHTMMWALLHEMGHMVHGHRPATRLDQIFRPAQTKLRAEAMENEADQFAVEALQSYKDDGRILVVAGMKNVALGLVAAALNAPDGMLPVPAAELNEPIPLARSTGTHPPMLIRLLDAIVVLDFSYLQDPAFKKLRSQVILKP